MNEFALVSVGIPTFNRLETLRRAVASVQAQDYSPIELIISDNASADGTEAYCHELVRSGTRVRYVRHQENRGPVDNFRQALKHATGEYFMWLGDDDWLDSDYVSACVRVLAAFPDTALANGTTRFLAADVLVTAQPPLTLLQHTGAERVLDYYRTVTGNGGFYGVVRRQQLERIPSRDVIGGDWMVVAALAFGGKVRGVAAAVNRSTGGMSGDVRSLVVKTGASRWLLLHPKLYFLSIMESVFYDVLLRNPVYRSLPLRKRLALGLSAALRIRRHYRVGSGYFILDSRVGVRVRRQWRALVWWIARSLNRRP